MFPNCENSALDVARSLQKWYAIAKEQVLGLCADRGRNYYAIICENGAGAVGTYEAAAYKLLAGDQPEGAECRGGAHAGGPPWAGAGEAP